MEPTPSGPTDPSVPGVVEGSALLALRDTEARFRALVETAVEGIVTIDSAGVIESVNLAMERMFGYSAVEMVGRNISMLMPPPHRAAHDGYLERYLQTGVAKIIGVGREVVGMRKDGTEFPMDLSVGEVRLAGGRFFTGILRDVTKRKEAEQKLEQLARVLREKNRELETIVYVASHDLRSPLVNIQGFSRELHRAVGMIRGLLEDVEVDPTAAKREIGAILRGDVGESLEYILAGVRKMDSLLSGFLRFSRLGRAALRVEALDMNGLVKGLIAAMDYQLTEAGVEVWVENLPSCMGDATQTGQVFTNLLDNAVKYRAVGRSCRIRVCGEVCGREVVYRVEDNGMGVATEHHGKIFEVFYRLDPGVTPGEGLGLSIAQRILERQNGRIWLESEVGVGSTFLVALPGITPGA